MSEKSVGVKGKPPDKHEALSDGNNQNAKGKSSNVNENACSSEKSELPKISDKPKVFEKKVDTKTSMKINTTSRNGTGKPRRDEDKRTSYPMRNPHSSSRGKPDSRTYSSSQSRSDTKRTDSNKSFTDDSRLSKYIRRVVREGDKERRISSARQLRDYLRTSEGIKATYKLSEDVFTSLQDVFYERTSKDLKHEVAKCVGIVGGIMGHDAHRYFQWLFSQTNNLIDDDIRSLFIDALFETLRYDEKKQATSSLMPMVMANVQTLLENADTPELLCSVVNVILHIAKHYPQVFTSHFRDTVDILVGWHIDSTQKDSLIDFTSNALIEFNRYWVNDISFSTTLLGQFLEDMEAYAEDLTYSTDQAYSEEELPVPDDCIIKIAALLKVFTTVIRSMGEEFTPSKQITREYMSQILDRIAKSVDTASRNYFSEYMIIEANTCILILIGQLKSEVVHSSEVLLSFLLLQIFTTKLVSYKFTQSMLSTCQKVIETFGTQLPVSFVSQLFAPGSLLQRYRFCHSEQVIQQLMALYHDVMALKSVPLLEEAFKYVVGDLQQAYNTLLHAAGEKMEKCVISVNPYSDVTYSVKEAEAVCIFNLCALAEIGNTKSNLIAMWALSPSIFDLVSKHFCPLEEVVSEGYPAVQYALLNTLFSHCARHGNFVSSSSLIMQSTRLDGSLMANVNPTTASNFTRILHLLACLLAHSTSSYDSRCLGMKWIGDIIGSLQTNPQIFCMEEFTNVIKYVTQLGHHHDFHITMSVCKCLQNIYKINSNMPNSLIQSGLKLSVYKLSDIRPEVREGYFSLLKVLPVNVTTRLYSLLHLCDDNDQSISIQEGAEGVTAAWLARRAHINHIPSGGFQSVNFRQIMAFILNDTPPIQSGSWNWLEAMFYSCQHSARESKGDPFKLSQFVDSNEAMLWFWATWEAAQYCVLNRLRTPLGKPQETFTSIEGVLKSYASELDKSNDERTDSKSEQKKGTKTEEYGDHLRVHLLLQFMEHLEKLLYNAFEGCALAMPMAPKTVRTFFRTNKGTCLEWLSRIRSTIIKIALHSGMPAMAVRQCQQLLNDMKDHNNLQGYEFEQTILYLVKALSQLQQSDAVMGVYNWCKEMTGKKLLWIKAMVEKASGRYENAVKEYKSVLKSMLCSDDDRIDSPREETAKSEIIMPKKITGILSKQSPFPQPDNNLPIMKINFVVREVFDCYERLGDWTSVIEWQKTVLQYRQDYNSMQAAFNSDIDLNYIKALSAFDSGDFGEVRECLELVPGATLTDMSFASQNYSLWSPKEKLNLIKKQFIRLTTWSQDSKVNSNRNDIMKTLSQVEMMEENVLRIASLEWPVLSAQEALTHICTTGVLRKQLEDKKAKMVLLPLSEDTRMDAEEHNVGVFLHLQRLLDIQRNSSAYDRKSSLNDQIFKMDLSIASLGRKQNNYCLAETVLVRQINTLLKPHVENGKVYSDSLLPALISLQSNNGVVSQLDVLQVEREGAKLLYALTQHKESIDVLSNSIVGFMCSDSRQDIKDKDVITSCSQLCGKSLLTLVKWLQVDHKYLSSVVGQLMNGQVDSVVTNNLQLLMDMEARESKKSTSLLMEEYSDELKIGDNPILGDSDSLVGRLLHLSTLESPTLSKAWFSLASWCYKWGRKSVDNASHGSVDLMNDEVEKIKMILPKGTSLEETEKVLSVLSQIHTPDNSEEDIWEQDQGQYDDGAETTRRQLLSCCLSLQIASEECVDSLLDIWRGIVHRIYHYYQLSAKAYFTYLQLNGGAKSEESDEDGNVISTLRLLRLLVKHAWELRTVLESGLASTPTIPWKGIIPQLFSRLSHPELYVRQSISDLLCRVAHDAPHLIVYPAIVGSSAKLDDSDQNREGLLNHYLKKQLDDDVDQDDQTSQEDEDEDVTNTMLQNCLASIVEALSHNNPVMIKEVKQLVHELRRITLLWDELWLGTLNQQHVDVTRKLQQLDAEVKKVMNNSSLTKDEKMAIIREKHKTIMKPTLYTLSRLQEITSQEAETPHEEWFQNTYGNLITTAMEKLENPTNPSHPSSSWQPFKQLHSSLQQRAQKRSSLILKMDRISPKLQSLKSTVIAMPGLGTSGKVVTVESVSNTVQILPTKTKPKKLIFLGSDGKRYPYLFKGLEDLHLDERIMQFLGIVNNMFISANRQEQQLFRARHYSVTPLGPRSGLIQWVDGATPLFSLYKRWQQRDALAQTQSGKNSTSNTATILRPSEIFYNKLTPALREKGITNLDNRKEWPMSVLRSVLQELMEETPGDLLSRELWCSSTGPNEWWHITQSYARSTAVMSMIGYIIGLGDRHLDNVLVDLATGEVVHIDYNVCFEKGKGLRVPEKVPYRMTQNIEMALGVTGIEGTFRTACEHVIKTMRKGRETLLTLLEAFVYDPLVDWTTGNEGGYAGAFYGGGGLSVLGAGADNRQTKRDMEREITLSMFSIRVAEMKVPWIKNRDDLLKALPRLQEQVNKWSVVADKYNMALANQQSMKDVKNMVTDALIDPDHPLYTLHDRYEEYAVVKSTRDSVYEIMEEKINEFSHWQKLHKHVIESIQGASFQKMCADVATSLNLGTASFATATDFLQGAGQSQIISQCEQLETEMVSYLQLQRSHLHRAIDVLHTYATIVSQFGTSFADHNRTGCYLLWLQEILCDFTSERCEDVVNQFHELYGKPGFTATKTQLILNTEAKLQTIITDVNTRLIKVLERRSQENAETEFLEHQIMEHNMEVQAFVRENGLSGVSSLMAWIISALSALNKRYNQMEGAAAGAGDRLMHLTSRDGDWFLDELCSMSSNVMHYIDVLKVNTSVQDLEHFTSLYQALTSTHNVYTALQDLNMNFRSIILPEALKAIQGQNPSVCNALQDMEKIFSDAMYPMDTVVSQLESLHRNAIMGNENDNVEMMTVVKKMQIQYQELLEGNGDGELSSGQMLLMGFNGLFTRLEDEFTNLIDAMDSLQVPDAWRKVDAVREGKAMQLSSFTSSTRHYLSSLFFVKRLQAMQTFFHMCTQFAANLQGLEGGNCYDDEHLSRPIKCFIAEYVRKQVIGFPSQVLGFILCVFIDALGVNVTAEVELKDIGADSKVPLEDLRKKAVDMCLKNNQFQHMHFTQASTLVSTLDSSWRRHDLARRLDSNLEVMKSCLQRTQLQLARVQWLHEDVYVSAGRHLNQMIMPNRATVMSEMRKSMQGLASQETGLVNCNSHYIQLEASIIQRLKWAAGANPSLNLVLQQFDEASAYRKHIYEEEHKRSTEVVSLCQGILHLEALRTRTTEAVTSDSNFLSLVNKCNETCIMMESTNSSVTDAEILLMSTKPPADGQVTDKKWLEDCKADIHIKIDTFRQQADKLRKDLEASKDSIKSEVTAIKSILTSHHKLMSDIRTILKSMSKQEEQEEGEHPIFGGIRDYLLVYKNYSENLTTALKIVLSEDMTVEGMKEAENMLETLIIQVPQIFDDLVSLAPPLISEEDAADGTADSSFASALKKPTENKDLMSPVRKHANVQRDVKTPPQSSQHLTLLTKISGQSLKKTDRVSRDPRTGKAIQERNSYAVGVWRRVKMKLDGRDPDINKRLSVAEQVEFVMKEANNLDNLAVLYEGWTPWV